MLTSLSLILYLSLQHIQARSIYSNVTIYSLWSHGILGIINIEIIFLIIIF